MSRSVVHWLRLGVDRLTIYLPIILTAALALGSYWLVRTAPKLSQARQEAPPTHDPDYFMRGFVVKRFLPDGELRSELRGKEGRHYPDTDTFEVDDVRMRTIAPNGLVTHGSARRGLSNADGSEIQLFGDAVVVRDAADGANGQAAQPRLEFRGEFLHVFTDQERVRSHKPVVLTRGQDQFTADAMDYDRITGVAHLNGRVRGVIQPAAPAAQPSAPARRNRP